MPPQDNSPPDPKELPAAGADTPPRVAMQERAAAMRERAREMTADAARMRHEMQLAIEEQAAGAAPLHETPPAGPRCPHCDRPLASDMRECPGCGADAWEGGQIHWEGAQTTWDAASNARAQAEGEFDRARAGWEEAQAAHARSAAAWEEAQAQHTRSLEAADQAEIAWEGAQSTWQRLNEAQHHRADAAGEDGVPDPEATP